MQAQVVAGTRQAAAMTETNSLGLCSPGSGTPPGPCPPSPPQWPTAGRQRWALQWQEPHKAFRRLAAAWLGKQGLLDLRYSHANTSFLTPVTSNTEPLLPVSSLFGPKKTTASPHPSQQGRLPPSCTAYDQIRTCGGHQC